MTMNLSSKQQSNLSIDLSLIRNKRQDEDLKSKLSPIFKLASQTAETSEKKEKTKKKTSNKKIKRTTYNVDGTTKLKLINNTKNPKKSEQEDEDFNGI